MESRKSISDDFPMIDVWDPNINELPPEEREALHEQIDIWGNQMQACSLRNVGSQIQFVALSPDGDIACQVCRASLGLDRILS